MATRSSARACRTTPVHHPDTVRAVDVRARMQADLKEAMKDRDSARVTVLRSTLGALANAEAVDAPTGPISLTAAAGTTEVARRELTHDDVRDVIERERAELLAAA